MKSRYGIFLPILLLLFAASASAETVRSVIDGDTLILEDNQRVRLIGVDAPEVDHPRYNKVGEPFGEEAKAFLKSKAEGREVRLVSGPEAYDKYGRRLAYVYAGEECLNESLLREGLGEAIRYLRYDRKETYLALEAEARKAGRGMWSGSPAEGGVAASSQSSRRGESVILLISGAAIAAVFVILQRRR